MDIYWISTKPEFKYNQQGVIKTGIQTVRDQGQKLIEELDLIHLHSYQYSFQTLFALV
ncbi:unnamed protein product [Paramecium primaurelia]|uniref:Uncharacterized protein n=1 Tax=Paramecium primaurelia TaxID=5886 RepID=A0A8S1NDW3_PARPR|nr:unnamed protein product [Paramecium primaurelia]